MELHENFNINLDYMNALVDLVNELRKNNIAVREFNTLNNGFQLKFEDFEGDAVIHDYSYGRDSGWWETYKFPWDEGDVSVLTAEELVEKLVSLKGKKKDPFLEAYKKLTAALKAQAALDMQKEADMYGED